jgi:hypothetical protein
MTNTIEISVHDLRPTQLTVGLIEVHHKMKHLSSLKPAAQREFMQAHVIPAVKGPDDTLFITDHHHLGRAAHELEIRSAFVDIEADFSACSMEEFWRRMDERRWVHPLDESGVRHTYDHIPKHLDKLKDDIYRSLAGYVRDAGGYDKTPTAFAEFVWADFFRRSLAVEEVAADFSAAVERALALATGEAAKGLPGARA